VAAFLNQIAKAIVAFVGTAYGAYQLATQEGSEAGSHVTSAEWQNVLLTAIATAILVWAMPNEPKPL
jgi:hypothetical protein